jgi:ABC1 atypical kinase-like domain
MIPKHPSSFLAVAVAMSVCLSNANSSNALVGSNTGSRRPAPPLPLRASTMDSDVRHQQKHRGGGGRDGADAPRSLGDRITNSGVASAAAVAAAAVNAAVAMKALEAPDALGGKSYVALDSRTRTEIDEEGLPLAYDKDLIQAYWSRERGALNQRWSYFLGKAVPFLTKLTTLFIRDGKITDQEIPALSRQARIDLQDLGPTFIKAGQMMSVRPDVLPPPALDELAKLQDAVVPFDTEVAVQQIERELGGPLGQFFTSISEKPVAAASLAQVYLATLNDGKDTKVAVKVQRPSVLGTVSKDLYVLRRAAEVFQGLVERFAPQQRTNYVALLNEWAIGFYTELDFKNEASNQQRLRDMLIEKGVRGGTVPIVYHDLCTRRILVSEWMDGKKLSEADPSEIKRVTPAAQEAFLTQLFEVGFFHAVRRSPAGFRGSNRNFSFPEKALLTL